MKATMLEGGWKEASLDSSFSWLSPILVLWRSPVAGRIHHACNQGSKSLLLQQLSMLGTCKGSVHAKGGSWKGAGNRGPPVL